MNPGHYAKALVAIIAAGLGILVTALQDNVLTPAEYVTVGIAIVTAVGVYAIPNFPEGVARYLKTGVAFAGAGLQALAIVLTDVSGWSDISSAAWISVVLAALGAVGVYVLPNSPAYSTTNTNNVYVAAGAQGVPASEIAVGASPADTPSGNSDTVVDAVG